MQKTGTTGSHQGVPNCKQSINYPGGAEENWKERWAIWDTFQDFSLSVYLSFIGVSFVIKTQNYV